MNKQPDSLPKPLTRRLLMRSAAYASLALTFYAFDSHADESAKTQIDGRKYLPLKLGRVTKYDVTVEPPVGKSRMATATNRVAEQTKLAGKTYFKVTTTIAGVPFFPDTLIYYRPAKEGIYQILEGDEESPEWLYLPASIKIGDHWGTKTPSGEFQFTALGVEDVETPAGKYSSCLKLSVVIKKTLVTNEQTQWLAEGVGSVRQTDSNAFFSATTVLKEISQEKIADEKP